MTENKGESNNILPSWLIALTMSGFGVIAIIVVLAINSEIAEMKTLVLVTLFTFVIILIYFVCRAVPSETPEWSTNAKRAESIGSILLFSGIIIGANPTYQFLGISIIILGTILNIITFLYPNSRIR